MKVKIIFFTLFFGISFFMTVSIQALNQITFKIICEGSSWIYFHNNNCSNIINKGEKQIIFYWENDVILDRGYSNGISYLYNYRFNSTALVQKYGFEILHEIYQPFFTLETPVYEDEPYLVDYDRPYLGYFALSYVEQKIEPHFSKKRTLRLGVIGPQAQGEMIQKNFHNLLGFKKPVVWNNQIGNETIVQINYDWELLNYGFINKNKSVPYLLYPRLGFKFGNLHIHSYIGMMLKLFTEANLVEEENNQYNWYTYISYDFRYVSYNGTFQGGYFDRQNNNAQKSTHTFKYIEHWVRFFSLGFSINTNFLIPDSKIKLYTTYYSRELSDKNNEQIQSGSLANYLTKNDVFYGLSFTF